MIFYSLKTHLHLGGYTLLSTLNRLLYGLIQAMKSLTLPLTLIFYV